MTAGLLLTGGAGRRMGADKAKLRRDGERLADRAARVLQAVCDPALEVGPSRTALPTVPEPAPGEGPLVALAAGAGGLRARGYTGAVLLLAVDLPLVEAPLLRWLAEQPGEETVVPVVGGEPQPCCARYGPDALEQAAELAVSGERSLRALFGAVPVRFADEGEWGAVALPGALDDADTPADAERLGLDLPGTRA